MMMDKKTLRARMAGMRNAIPPAERKERSRLICRHALAILRGRMRETAGKAVLVYIPFRSEADTWPLIRDLWQLGVPVAAPKTERTSGELALYVIQNETQLRPGAYGIPEPDPMLCKPASPADIGAVIVPGLAFDREGGRLGYGAGYYDRLFRRYAEAGLAMPLRIGFAFAAQLVDRVPVDERDVPVNLVVTEEGACRAGPRL